LNPCSIFPFSPSFTNCTLRFSVSSYHRLCPSLLLFTSCSAVILLLIWSSRRFSITNSCQALFFLSYFPLPTSFSWTFFPRESPLLVRLHVCVQPFAFRLQRFPSLSAGFCRRSRRQIPPSVGEVWMSWESTCHFLALPSLWKVGRSDCVLPSLPFSLPSPDLGSNETLMKLLFVLSARILPPSLGSRSAPSFFLFQFFLPAFPHQPRCPVVPFSFPVFYLHPH